MEQTEQTSYPGSPKRSISKKYDKRNANCVNIKPNRAYCRWRRSGVSNRLCPYHDEAEEQAAREAAVAGQLGVFRTLLPKLLKDLSNIGDPRQAKKVKHKLTAVLLYGLLSFVFQMASLGAKPIKRSAARHFWPP